MRKVRVDRRVGGVSYKAEGSRKPTHQDFLRDGFGGNPSSTRIWSAI